MSVRFFYVDESYDEAIFCLSAIGIRHSHWRECFNLVREHRVRLREDYGFFLNKEIHARDLVHGRGRLSNSVITKWQRSRIFLGLLRLVASLPTVQVFNICLEKKNRPDPQMQAWDRLMNRIERTMRAYEEKELPLRRQLITKLQGASADVKEVERRLRVYAARAFIISDEGRENEITAAVRRMRVYNYIPSQFGQWQPGVSARNITTDRIIEDPVFKNSQRSYFLQLADCVAFALLKQESSPTDFTERYAIRSMFRQSLAGVCFKPASPRDPQGIVRQ